MTAAGGHHGEPLVFGGRGEPVVERDKGSGGLTSPCRYRQLMSWRVAALHRMTEQQVSRFRRDLRRDRR